jgi:hypothetical protein
MQQRGLWIDATALLSSLRRLLADETLTVSHVDEAMRRHRAHRLDYPISRAVRGLLRRVMRGSAPAARPPEYFMDMYSWQKLRRRRVA